MNVYTPPTKEDGKALDFTIITIAEATQAIEHYIARSLPEGEWIIGVSSEDLGSLVEDGHVVIYITK